MKNHHFFKINWIDFPTISVEKGDWTSVEAEANSKGNHDVY